MDAVPVHLLRKHLQVFRDRIDFDQLLPQLYQDSVLSYEEEIMKIQLEKSRAIQTMHLVHMIEKKGKTGLKMFVNSLKKEMQHIGHHELASDLVNGIKLSSVDNFFVEEMSILSQNIIIGVKIIMNVF